MKRFKSIRWVFLSISILLNGFLILYSALPYQTTDKWSKTFTNIFASIVNKFTVREVVEIPVKSIQTRLSPKENYAYNDIPGYKLNEIPLGSAKQVESKLYPEDATNKGTTYFTDYPEFVSLNQDGLNVSVVGMTVGTAKIYAKNPPSGLTDECTVNVVDLAQPYDFDISTTRDTLSVGQQETISIDIDGGVLGHDELINFRYYDTRKLSFISSNNSVATVNKYGVIKPISEGQTTITVKNNRGITRHKTITINGGTAPSLYSNLHIEGDNYCYGNDMILDQRDHKHNHILSIYDDETLLNNSDFIWECNNELLARVDQKGVVRGFRKSKFEDENVTIKAISKLTGQECTFNVLVKTEPPQEMYYSIEYAGKTLWNTESVTCCVGDNLLVKIGYKTRVVAVSGEVTNYDSSMMDVTNQGSSFTLNIKQIGTSKITIKSNNNPDLKATFEIVILEKGAISSEDLGDIGHDIRKIIGHASLFAITQIFTFLTFYMFMYEKEIWKFGTFSLLTGLGVSVVSEIVQIFAESRQCTFIDMLINFSGVAAGIVLVLFVFVIKTLIKKNKVKNTK